MPTSSPRVTTKNLSAYNRGRASGRRGKYIFVLEAVSDDRLGAIEFGGEVGCMVTVNITVTTSAERGLHNVVVVLKVALVSVCRHLGLAG